MKYSSAAETEIFATVQMLLPKLCQGPLWPPSERDLYKFIKLNWREYTSENLSKAEDFLIDIPFEMYLFLAAKILLFINERRAAAFEEFFVFLFLTLPTRRAPNWVLAGCRRCGDAQKINNAINLLLRLSEDILSGEWDYDAEPKADLLSDLQEFTEWLQSISLER